MSAFAITAAPLLPGFPVVLQLLVLPVLVLLPPVPLLLVLPLLVLPLLVLLRPAARLLPRAPRPELPRRGASSVSAGASASAFGSSGAVASAASASLAGEPPGSPGAPSPGPLRGQAARRPSPCSSSCLIRASMTPTRSRIGAANRPTTVVSEPASAPTSWARSTSAGGSFARRLTSSAPISSPSRKPPLTTRTSVLPASSSAFATATGSPSVSRKAIAVGPSRSVTRPSTPAASAARFVSVFLTTVNRAPCSISLPRSSSISETVRPR